MARTLSRNRWVEIRPSGVWERSATGGNRRLGRVLTCPGRADEGTPDPNPRRRACKATTASPARARPRLPEAPSRVHEAGRVVRRGAGWSSEPLSLLLSAQRWPPCPRRVCRSGPPGIRELSRPRLRIRVRQPGDRAQRRLAARSPASTDQAPPPRAGGLPAVRPRALNRRLLPLRPMPLRQVPLRRTTSSWATRPRSTARPGDGRGLTQPSRGPPHPL